MRRKAGAGGLIALLIVGASGVKTDASDRSARARRVPIGEVVANGHVFLNGMALTSGSTVFEGSAVRTARGGTAILALRSGAGVIALLPESEARVREANRIWVIELARGTALIRAREATEVTIGRVHVRSPHGNFYRIAVSDEGVRVETLERPVAIRVEGREFTLAAERSLLLRNDGAHGEGGALPQTPQSSRARRRVVIPAVVIGALTVTLALTVARGERSKVVSPVAPHR